MSEKRRTPEKASRRVRKVQRSPRISMARAIEQVSGRCSSYIAAYCRSAAERDELPGQSDRVVVGDQEALAGQHAQLRVGQQVDRLLGDGQRMRLVGVR